MAVGDKGRVTWDATPPLGIPQFLHDYSLLNALWAAATLAGIADSRGGCMRFEVRVGAAVLARLLSLPERSRSFCTVVYDRCLPPDEFHVGEVLGRIVYSQAYVL